MKEKTIKETEVPEIIDRIRNDPKSSFAVFLSLELKERYADRPVEEAHLGFNQWRKLLMLREDKKDEAGQLRTAREQRERWEKQRNRVKESNKNPYHGVHIPNWMKNSTTRALLSMRHPQWNDDEIDYNALYAELATREHVPNKAEAKEKRREAAKRKK